jgi:hypothetical protein
MSIAIEYRVATADGEGAGRFLALSLADALNGGGELISIAPRCPGRLIEFVFQFGDSVHHEVLRAHVGTRGEIVQADLIRRPVSEHRGGSAPDNALVEALRFGHPVLHLSWDDVEEDAKAPLRVTLRTEGAPAVPNAARH